MAPPGVLNLRGKTFTRISSPVEAGLSLLTGPIP